MKKSYNVVAAIILKEDKYFCVKRGPGRPLANKWEFPGGKVVENETHHDALVREIKEELNSLVEVKDYLMTVSYDYETFHINLHAYYCGLIEGDLDLTEHIDKKWVNKSDLKYLDWADADWPLIEKLLGGNEK